MKKRQVWGVITALSAALCFNLVGSQFSPEVVNNTYTALFVGLIYVVVCVPLTITSMILTLPSTFKLLKAEQRREHGFTQPLWLTVFAANLLLSVVYLLLIGLILYGIIAVSLGG
ncbi:hypothetical protein [Aliidiomarina soli]|uniref:Uncharacterized protein n=1 Tax=Aliidiomarina soli TaxID=1928574 RepID=A0A432WHH9_9GAMM|nr:hypothetical protein [Aliidiomarina soli]RUO33181.1 hypothetical protein CWE14_08125 [Aliidiomarina soli]